MSGNDAQVGVVDGDLDVIAGDRGEVVPAANDDFDPVGDGPASDVFCIRALENTLPCRPEAQLNRDRRPLTQ